MDHVSRRSLLTTASATVAAAGVVAVVGSRVDQAAAAPATTPAAAPKAAPLSAHVVARVRDLRTGDVDLFLGEKEVTVRDSSLAHAIARAAQQHAV